VGYPEFSGKLVNSSLSFTPSYTGFSTAPTGDWLYYDFGVFIVLWVGATGYAQGTSNANTFTITNLPSAIRPSDQTWILVAAIDGGAAITAAANIGATGTITFIPQKLADAAGSWPSTATANIKTVSNGWATSGNKALTQGAFMVYAK